MNELNFRVMNAYNEVAAYLYNQPEVLLSEFDFIRRGNRLVSNNNLKICGRVGTKKGQVMIYDNNKEYLFDPSENMEGVRIFQYLMDSRNLTAKETIELIKQAYYITESNVQVQNIVKQKASKVDAKPVVYRSIHEQYLLRSMQLFDCSGDLVEDDLITFNQKQHTIKRVEGNISNFHNYLLVNMGLKATNNIIKRYFLGRSNYRNGSVIFWSVDRAFQVLRGKIMEYTTAGKRAKNSYATNSVHAQLKKKGIIAESDMSAFCYFGTHLLTLYPEKTVAIVESEKTACICSEVFTKYNWLATGSKSTLSAKNLSAYKDKIITLFPDKGSAFKEWSQKAAELQAQGYQIKVSQFLENYALASDKDDILDVLFVPDLSAKCSVKTVAVSEQSKPHLAEYPVTKSPKIIGTGFIDAKGSIYIQNPMDASLFAHYISVAAYKNRTSSMVYVRKDLLPTECEKIEITIGVEGVFRVLKGGDFI